MAIEGMEVLLGRAPEIDRAQMKEIIQIGHKYGNILDWCWLGQPGIDGLCGRISVDRKKVGDLVRDLIAFDHPRIIVGAFPLGKPAPDQVLVDITTDPTHRYR